MGRRKNMKFGQEFKNKAVELADDLGSVTEAARKLGVKASTLHSWILRKEDPTPVIVVETPEEELKRLRKENGELKKANNILKAAAAFFSQDHLK